MLERPSEEDPRNVDEEANVVRFKALCLHISPGTETAIAGYYSLSAANTSEISCVW
jgi:hypothetical protein